MASAQAAAVQKECWVHLHIPLDMNDEGERRFGELFEALPNGMKTNFCKSLLVGSVPIEEVDLDLLLAKFIRETKGRGKRRGRPAHTKKTAPAAVIPAPVPGAQAAEQGQEEKGPRKEGAEGDFSNLAGGKGW